MVNTLCDKSCKPLTLPTGEVIPYNPYFRLILLFNEGSAYTGTRDVNAALKERLQPIETNYPSESVESKMLQNTTDATPQEIKQVLELVKIIRREVKGFDMSIRTIAKFVNVAYDPDVFTSKKWLNAYATVIASQISPTDEAKRALLRKYAEQAVSQWRDPVPQSAQSTQTQSPTINNTRSTIDTKLNYYEQDIVRKGDKLHAINAYKKRTGASTSDAIILVLDFAKSIGMM